MRLRDLINVTEQEDSPYFITDMGHTQPVIDKRTGKTIFMLPQFGVWGDKGRGKPEVIESSNDLEYLKKKYNTEQVIKIG